MAIRSGLITGATGITILTAGLLLGIPREAPAPPISAVQVVNTPADPVPTAAQGTTLVGGNVAVTNTANNPVPTAAQGTTLVGGNVAVTNDLTNPVVVRDADQPAKQAFQADEIAPIAAGSDAVAFFFSVPIGHRLVIQHVTATISDSPGVPHLFTVLTTLNNQQGLHAIKVDDVGTFPNGLAAAVASQEVQFYADGGTNVRLLVVRGTTTGPASARVTLSGYLVNLP
jgi:hypothetical protein